MQQRPSRPALRPAAVAGRFYPDDPPTLRRAVAAHLAAAPPPRPAARPPKLLVLPHAGYVYSGDVAALGYAELAPWRDTVRRVVLMGPVHRVPVHGLAASSADAFQTPLGPVTIDRDALAALDDLPQVVTADLPHAMEHSLEVHLPFLQTVLGDGFRLVPFAVGNATPHDVAEVLQRLWGGDETLIVISSDLSHYLPYDMARERDGATVQRIVQFATDLDGHDACGAAPLNGALRLAHDKGLVPRLLGVRNSGDAEAGRAGRERVVGYGAIAFDPPGAALPRGHDAAHRPADEPLGAALVTLARRALAEAVGVDPPAGSVPDLPALARPGATFVTLHSADGALRGCVGRLEATRPLREDVAANAVAAALRDDRFTPLQAHEWPGLQVEVSLLDAPEPIAARSEDEALAALRPGDDGVILEWQGRRATFLPQVWSQLPAPRDFMAELKRKAGLPPGFWAPDVALSRYRVRTFKDTP